MYIGGPQMLFDDDDDDGVALAMRHRLSGSIKDNERSATLR